jgi:hypothetical protein
MSLVTVLHGLGDKSPDYKMASPGRSHDIDMNPLMSGTYVVFQLGNFLLCTRDKGR